MGEAYKGNIELVGFDLTNQINDFSGVTIDDTFSASGKYLISELQNALQYELVGGFELKDELYLYGLKKFVNSSNLNAFIYKSIGNQEFVSFAEFGEVDRLSMSDVLNLEDSLLVAHLAYGVENESELFLIDLDGNISSKLFYEEWLNEKNIIVGDESSIFFNSDVFPGEGFSSRWKSERINKFVLEGDSLEWSSRTPEYYFFDVRSHKVLDLSLSENFIFSVGATGDKDSLTCTGRHPYVSKMNKNGEIEWLRIYKKLDSENQNISTPYALKSELLKSVAIADNHIVNIGWTFYKTLDGELTPKLWLLSLNENGCLPSEECNHRILLDNEINSENDSMFSEGFTWNYDLMKDTTFGGIDYINHSSIEFKVGERVTIGNKTCNVVENNRNLPELYMHQDFEKIFFWDELEQEFKLFYDFDAIREYKGTVFDECTGDVFFEEFFLDGEEGDFYIAPNPNFFTFIQKGFYKIDNEPTPNQIEVLMRVGQLYGGLYFNNSTNCKEEKIGFLRCFTSGDTLVNITSNHFDGSFECNETWVEVITSTEINSLESTDLKIYQNPTHGSIFLSHKCDLIRVLDIRGRVLQTNFNTNSIDLENLSAGVYILNANGKYLKFILLGP